MSQMRMIIGVAIAMALIILVFSVKGCLDARQRAAQAKYETKAADAYAGAAKGAVEAVAARSEEEAELKEVVAEAAKEIAQAEGSTDAIPPAARVAALNAACRLPDYRDHPRCQVQPARP